MSKLSKRGTRITIKEKYTDSEEIHFNSIRETERKTGISRMKIARILKDESENDTPYFITCD